MILYRVIYTSDSVNTFDNNNNFAGGNCTQEDFLWIASVIRSTTSDVNISDLSRCLGVSFDGRDETGDQLIVQSFLLWQSKNGEDSSRAKLLQCLQQLQNAPNFMDKLRERYS